MVKHRYNKYGYRFYYDNKRNVIVKIHKCDECEYNNKIICGKPFCMLPRCIKDNSQ